MTDVRFAVRQLRAAPSTTTVMVATLALGISANAVMAGAINRLLFQAPDHVLNPDRVIRLVRMPRSTTLTLQPSTGLNYATVVQLRRELDVFSDVAGQTSTTLLLGDRSDDVEVQASLVSPSYFQLLGVRPLLGRFFSETDGYPRAAAPGGPPLAVLSYGYWQSRYSGDRSVLGKTIRMSGFAESSPALTYVIVGIAPKNFSGLEPESPDVWLPVQVTAEGTFVNVRLDDPSRLWLSIVCRLRPGVSPEAAAEKANAIWRQLQVAGRDTLIRIVAAPIILGRGPDRPRDVAIVLWLGGVSLLVMLIACANVGNLLLARLFRRRREIAVRLALGASRERVTRQFIAEGLTLATMGGAAALVLASASGTLVRQFLIANASGSAFIDFRVLRFTSVIVLGTGLLVSLAPLVHSGKPDLNSVLRHGVSGARTSRARVLLLVTQCTMCMTLLVGAGLFALSFYRVRDLDLGLDVERTLTAFVNVPQSGRSRSDVETEWAAIAQQVRQVDGVEGVALVEGNLRYSGHSIIPFTEESRGVSWLKRSGSVFTASMLALDTGFFQSRGRAVAYWS